MNKECPHCRVDAFRLRDLFQLDYFHPSQCPNCGGLIRNSGWSQFLGPAITIVWLFVGGSALRFLPEWLVFSILILTVPLPWLILSKPVRADTPRVDFPPFTPDLHNDKSIVVKGWNETELSKIIDDFIDQKPSVPLRVEKHKRFDREWELHFPDDFPAFDFIAMVNYLNYPLDVPTPEDVSILGKATLTSDFQGMPEKFIGTKAIFYIPEEDYDFDVVFVETENHANFRYSVSQQMWASVRDGRIPSEVAMLR